MWLTLTGSKERCLQRADTIFCSLLRPVLPFAAIFSLSLSLVYSVSFSFHFSLAKDRPEFWVLTMKILIRSFACAVRACDSWAWRIPPLIMGLEEVRLLKSSERVIISIIWASIEKGPKEFVHRVTELSSFFLLNSMSPGFCRENCWHCARWRLTNAGARANTKNWR